MTKLLSAAAVCAALALGAAQGVGASPIVQKVALTIAAGDRMREANVALAPGLPVQVTIVNRTREFHTFTIPGLKVSELIRPAGATTFTFTPERWGTFAWHCLVCPSGHHGRPHAMGGVVYLITDPSALG